eukprot:Pompholyxophrys_punicea_v1_NODE_126_length_3319_cov_18.116115.p1 type:complete len:664 gc:universal NODE_126_length_3319_cov_18.116115:2957-966(-)
MNPRLLRKVKHVHDLQKISAHTKDSFDILKWKQARRALQTQTRAAKRCYYTTKLEAARASPARTWKILNEIRGKTRPSSTLPDSLIVDGLKVNSPLEIAVHFNNYFASIGSQRSTIPSNNTPDHELSPPLKNVPAFVLTPCTAEDVVAMISELKGQTIDALGIHTCFLKDGAEFLSHPIAFLVNLSLNTGTFPSLLKVARLVPIFKKGARDDISNYRPISILPLLSKLYEKFIDKQLRAHLDAHNMWNKNQYGFRKNFSTTMALVRLYEQVLTNFGSSHFGAGVFLDVRRAFDSVSHSILLRKLPDYGITGYVLEWFTSYLHCRSQFILTRDGPTPVAQITSGVPQGSVLGPLLFNLFINDLPDVLQSMWPSIFADDTNLFLFSKSLSELATLCTADLDAVSRWFVRNDLQPNVDKSAALLFASPSLLARRSLKLPNLPFYGSELTAVTTTKFLGVQFSSTLDWSDHVSILLKRLSRLSGLFFLLRASLPTSALKTLYNSLVLPHLSYAVEIWGSSSRGAGYLRPIFVLQKRLVRHIAHLAPRAHTAQVFHSLSILPIFDLHRLKICLLAHKVLNNESQSRLYGLSPLKRASSVHHYQTRFSSSQCLFHPNLPAHFGHRSVAYNMLKEWNSLPLELREVNSPLKFKRLLKLYITEQALKAVVM